MRVYLPSDRFQTGKLLEYLIKDDAPAYVRIGRNAVEDIYSENEIPFKMDKATIIREGSDVTIIACGEMVSAAAKAGDILAAQGISARVLDMYCVKPIDEDSIIKSCKETKAIVTIEEHCAIGGMGSMVSQIVGRTNPVPIINMTLPDSPVIAGKSGEVFDHYGLNADGIVKTVLNLECFRKELSYV